MKADVRAIDISNFDPWKTDEEPNDASLNKEANNTEHKRNGNLEQHAKKSPGGGLNAAVEAFVGALVIMLIVFLFRLIKKRYKEWNN